MGADLTEYKEDYKRRFSKYEFRIEDESFDPENSSVDVRLKTKDGREYWSVFITIKNLQQLFEKNKRTGECMNGTYLTIHPAVVVERIDEETIKKSIDGLIDELSIEENFKEIQRDG